MDGFALDVGMRQRMVRPASVFRRVAKRGVVIERGGSSRLDGRNLILGLRCRR